MKDGIHYGLSFDEYRRIDAINQSALTRGVQSPAHMKAYLDGLSGPSGNTEALTMGSLIHTAVLEPHLLKTDFAILPKVDKRTTAGKQIMADFEAINKNKIPVSADEMRTAKACRDAVRAHPLAGRWLGAGEAEVTALWTMKGVRCKGRIDWWPRVTDEGTPLIVDLKTTKDASPNGFAKSVAQYGYHIQAAFYLDGYRKIMGNDAKFVFVAVEKEPPYAVAVYELEDEAIDLGRNRYVKALDAYSEYREKEEWPAYSTEVQTLELPPWAYRS